MGQQGVEPGAVVFLPDVAQLVDHHGVNGFRRVLHEIEGEADAVFAAAAAKAGFGGSDLHARGDDPHPGGVHRHPLGDDLPGPAAQFGVGHGPGQLLLQQFQQGFGDLFVHRQQTSLVGRACITAGRFLTLSAPLSIEILSLP